MTSVNRLQSSSLDDRLRTESESQPLITDDQVASLQSERYLAILARVAFVSPGRGKGYNLLTMLAILWHWYVVAMDLYLVWKGQTIHTVRDPLFSSTENLWTLSQAISFTLAAWYMYQYDNSDHTASKDETGFLPRAPGNVALLSHLKSSAESSRQRASSEESPAITPHSPKHPPTVGREETSEDPANSSDGFQQRPWKVLPSFRKARQKFFLHTWIAVAVSYFLVSIVLVLDGAGEYFFDSYPTRAGGNSSLNPWQEAMYWPYFAGFYWGMYASVTVCCLFALLCEHLIRAIAVLESRLTSPQSTSLKLGDAISAHERLLTFLKRMTRTFAHWFIVHLCMLVLVFIAIVLGFVVGSNKKRGALALHWLSVFSMTLVSAFQFSYPVMAASAVSHRWNKFRIRLARSPPWLRREEEYRTLMTYIQECEEKSGFVIFGRIKVSGSLLFRFGALAAGLFGLIRVMSGKVF